MDHEYKNTLCDGLHCEGGSTRIPPLVFFLGNTSGRLRGSAGTTNMKNMGNMEILEYGKYESI